MLTVLSVIGTRPEAIKMAPVIQELERHPDRIRAITCATGQHRQMLDQALGIFGISPDIDLDLMLPNQSLAQITVRVLTALEAVVDEVRPDWVLVQGDTTTAMAASLLAFYKRINVGHVEAGLRTDDRFQPFPEEINRRIVDQLATLYFAPTDENRRRLIREGASPETVIVTGNTVIDALLDIASRPEAGALNGQFPPLDGKRLVLITAHRRENFGEPLRDICRAIAELAGRYADDVHFVYPVHLNPLVQEPVREILGHIPNVSLTDPVDYQTLIALMALSTLILTDSGGLQEEAPSLDVPVLILRNVTERMEGVLAGATRLVGTETRSIVDAAMDLLDDPAAHAAMARVSNPYGDGLASRRIVNAILDHEAGRHTQPDARLRVAAD